MRIIGFCWGNRHLSSNLFDVIQCSIINQPTSIVTYRVYVFIMVLPEKKWKVLLFSIRTDCQYTILNWIKYPVQSFLVSKERLSSYLKETTLLTFCLSFWQIVFNKIVNVSWWILKPTRFEDKGLGFILSWRLSFVIQFLNSFIVMILSFSLETMYI